MNFRPVARLLIEPEPSGWGSSIAARWERARRDPRAMDFRAQLGLPTDRPIVMSGHQAAFWHGGILAKWIACAAAAEAYGGSSAWIVVDQDENDFTPITMPCRDSSGALVTQRWTLVPQPAEGVASSSLAPVEPRECPYLSSAALPSVAEGAQAIVRSLAGHRREESLARQIGGATRELLVPCGSLDSIIYATTFSATSLFAELLRDMRADAARALGAYNQAVQAHPEAGLAPLRTGEAAGRWELPVWELGRGTPRMRVDDARAANLPMNTLAPRAIFMTALARLGACDLFIHGLGGGIYDVVTEEWMRRWLGLELAPTAVVTADLLLPLAAASTTPADLARAHWRLHRAMHDPAALGLESEAARKEGFVQRIRAERAEGRDALHVYREMHAMLEQYRLRHAVELENLAKEIDDARRGLAESRAAADRNWAFPFHEPRAIRELTDLIRSRFGRRPIGPI